MPAFARFTRILLFCLCNLLTIHSIATAQEQTMIAQSGVSPTGSYQPGGIDTINLQNGGVVLNIPILSYPQVGSKLKFSFSLNFSPTPWFFAVSTTGNDASTDTIHYTGTWHNYDPEVSSAIGSPIGVKFTRDQDIYVTYEQLTYPCVNPSGFCGGLAEPTGNTGVTATYAELYSLVTADGGVHNFGIEGKDGSPGVTFVPTLDGTNFAPINGPFGGFIGPDGVKYTPLGAATGQNASSYTQSDPEGNGITYGPSGWTDSMGRHIAMSPTGPGVPASGTSQCTAASTAQSVVVPASNGSSATYTLCYANQTAATSFATPYQPNSTYYLITTQQGGGTQLLINQLILPNGTSYSFTYDNYLNITSVTLPTGGKIAYGWQTVQWNDITHQQSRAIQTRTVTNIDGSTSTWTYTITPELAQDVSASTLITDPAKNDEEHIFAGVGSGTYAGDASETINYYNGTGSTRSLLKTTVLYRSSLGSPIRLPSQDGGQPYAAGPIIASITTLAATNQVSQILYTQTPASVTATYVDYPSNFGGPQGYSEQTCGCFSTVQPQTEKDYDYGNGQPGQLLRQINTQYQWQQVPSYLSANLLDLPYSSTIQDGSGNQLAQTQYSYDEANGSPQGILGNATSVKKWRSGSSFTTSSVVYSSFGIPQQTTDPNGNVAKTTAFSCNGAFPQTVVAPFGSSTLAETTVYSYDCSTGAVVGVTDPNNHSSTYSFDVFNRPLSANYPDGGSKKWNYTDGSPSSVLVTTQTGNPAGPIISNTIYDGFGRVTTTQLQSDATGVDKVDTTYDSLGRVYTVSNPYRSTGDPTYGITSYSYDGLGRRLLECHPDNGNNTPCVAGSSYLQWSYTGNVTTAYDELRNSSQSTNDALGRLTNVMEPSGAQTIYTYDALGNLLNVNQKGVSGDTPRSRSFTYDSLSRLITSASPETGTICYGQWSSGKCVNGYDANGNLLYKTDARGVTINYNYDSLNRLISKTYSGVTGSISNTPPSTFIYDKNNGVAVPNAIGRLVTEFTGPSNAPITQRTIAAYDAMGRILQETQCVTTSVGCSAKLYTLNYQYDLGGNLTYSTNGSAAPAIGLTYGYDGAGRLQKLTSNQTAYPIALFGPSSIGEQYNPAGALENALYGTGLSVQRTYDMRLRPTGETDIWTTP